ncbi:MAG TPA: hypothetical protein VFB89_03155 [Gemmatimonadales bacterium]|nr:hypothetical protein [Gemmatimonadales bacterium]
MARKIRYTPEGGALFEITCRTIHSRFLFRPTRRFNEILVGILARAKTRYGVEISAFCCRHSGDPGARSAALLEGPAPRTVPSPHCRPRRGHHRNGSGAPEAIG